MKLRILLLLCFFGMSHMAYSQLNCGVDAGVGGDICPGESLQLSATVVPDTLDFRYFWAPSTGLSDTSIANPIASPTQTTTYVLTVTAVDSTDLVFNGDFSLGNTGFNTQYYDTLQIFNEGTYYVGTNAQIHHPGFSPCGDHTGGGRYMIINGNSSSNTVIWSQLVNVTPFTEYEFSTWVTNVLQGTSNLPLLQFSINGQLIGQPFTSAQIECEWTEFFTNWQSDTSSTALIEIVNQNTVVVGNDFGIDDIAFRAVCRTSDSVTVNVSEEYSADIYGLGEGTLICDGTPVTLTTTVPGAHDYVWQDGSDRPDYTVGAGGTYHVTLLDNNNCTFSDTITFSEGLSPQITLPADTTICEDNIVSFNVYDPSATSYLWRGPSVYFLQNDPTDSVFTATFPGIYEVDITNECGTLTQIIDLKTKNCVCTPFIPNSFTPNNDGKNDELQIFTGCDITELKFSVFNRWGELVFYTEDVNQGWDGTLRGSLAPNGVYVFKMEYQAENFKGEVVPNVLYGDITLITN